MGLRSNPLVGWPAMEASPGCMIGASAMRFQRRVESGEQVVVGVNKYRADDDAANRPPVERPDAAAMQRHLDDFRSMLERGVAFAPGAYEAMFPSLAHTWNDIERTTDLALASARTVHAEIHQLAGF